MIGNVQAPTENRDAALCAERARLVRLCALLTGDTYAAEDLAQETLLIALRQERALRNPARRASWLSGIARNLCLHWRRRRGLELARSAQPLGGEDPSPLDVGALPADDYDPEIELERGELVELLDRSMALLPRDTREGLVDRYVRESSHAEIAERLGVSEEAVKKRIERGKLALRRVLTTDLRAEALSFGLIAPETDGWRETRVWCPGCGRRRLEARFKPDEGELYMRCPGCSPPYAHYIGSHLGDGFKGLRTHKPAVSRVLTVIHDMFRVPLAESAVPCPDCGDRLPIRRGIPRGLPLEWIGPGPESLYLLCPRCGFCDAESWHSLTWSLPEARRFWREHPRMRFLPEREIEAAGSPAVVTGFEDITGGARLEVVSLRDTYEVLSITGI